MMILFIKNKKYSEMKKYLFSLITSAIIAILIFPFSIDHMLRSDRRVGSFEEGNILNRIKTYFNLVFRYFGSKWNIIIALFIIALISIMIKRKKERNIMSLIILPAIAYTIIMAFLTEFIDLRYVMNILPLVSIMIVLAVGTIFEHKQYDYIIALTTVILLLGYGFLTEEPLYLYKGYNKYIEISEKYSEDRFVYVGYTFFNHMQSMPEFMNYKESIMVYNDQLDAVIENEKLKEENEFILSVNISMNPEEVAKTIVDKTEFTNYELIYDGCDYVEQIIYRVYKER